MTVATFLQPDFTTQSAAAYKAALDAAFAVAARNIDAFAPHQQDVGSPAPDLTVRVDAGFILNSVTLTEVAAQTVSGFTIPAAGQERVDRVVINGTTGVATRVAGTAVTGSPSATPPAISADCIPCCRVRLTSSDTGILNSMITDERVPGANIVVSTTGDRLGTTTNNNAAAGYIGEHIESIVAPVTTGATSTVQMDITSISLTAGDWDVFGLVQATNGGATVLIKVQGSISNTSATADAASVANQVAMGAGGDPADAPKIAIPTIRKSLAGTTIFYLVGVVNFTGSTFGLSGRISARRVR